MEQSKYFKLFTNCLVIKGANRSLIVDIQRNSFIAISDTMQEVITKFNEKKTIEEVITYYGQDNKEIIEEYLAFLLDHEFGFIAEYHEFDLFPEMNKSFDIPSIISNAIVEVSEATLNNLPNIIKNLESLFCKDVQFIGYNEISLDTLKSILSSTKDADFRSIELILTYSPEILEFLTFIDQYNFRIIEVTLHSTIKKIEPLKKYSFDVHFIEKPITSFKNCGIIDTKYFNTNRDKVLESLNHNSCLHKKIAIDKYGDIRNCPAIPESFGNINDTNLIEAVNKTNFKKYWNITKDQITICKDCEFRHICTDCRAYIEDPNDSFSKPLKCGYSPYTNKWEEWSSNPLKQKAIEYYGMQELVKKDV